MKKVLALLFVLTILSLQAQESEKHNLGFENQTDVTEPSDGWFQWGDYDLDIDSLAHSGEKSGKISSIGSGSSFGSIVYSIPGNYAGKKITLEGYMKIKDVKNGHAGLILRIDGASGSLAFDNMEHKAITGTKDWKKYSITLEYPEGAKMIYLGGILVGKGEAWFDDFVLKIDGESIQTLEEVERVLSKAEQDKEFDDGSLISLSDFTSENSDNLELLGRVWGFLKYHHPEIAKGNYNWDYELFRFLPKYLETNNEKKRNEALISWIDSFGKVEICTTCKPTDEKAFLKPDLEWIENQSADLKNKLLYIYENRSQGDHYYIAMNPGVGNPDFKNESQYHKMEYSDDGFKLLALYRYWNMINYFFPYKHLMDKEWDITLKEYIPLFIEAESKLDYELVTLQLIGDIQDTHANLWGGGVKIEEWKGVNYPPFQLSFLEDKLVVVDYFNPELKEAAGMEIGDVTTHINGENVQDIIKEKSKYYPASNIPTQLRNMAPDLLRSNSKEVEVHYISKNGERQTMILQLYPKEDVNMYNYIKESDQKSFRMLDDNIGYVTLQTIKKEDIKRIKSEFKKTKGIIIDIRNYPSYFVPFTLGSYFVSSSSPFVRFTTGSINNPGEFIMSEALEIPSIGKTYKGKLIVLVNEKSQSQAEYTALAFRAGKNTTIVGSTTAGADGNVSTISLPGGIVTMISGIGINYPNGDETQRVGIVPDVEVNPTVEGIRNNKDELLEKAIELILEE